MKSVIVFLLVALCASISSTHAMNAEQKKAQKQAQLQRARLELYRQSQIATNNQAAHQLAIAHHNNAHAIVPLNASPTMSVAAWKHNNS